MLQNSLTDGALFLIAQEERDISKFIDSSLLVVSEFWDAVSKTFKYAWNQPPQKSRLTHGVGIAAMGYVMDHMYCYEYATEEWTADNVMTLLDKIKIKCAWTGGFWGFGSASNRRWNELQNTDRDIRLLTNYFRKLLSNR